MLWISAPLHVLSLGFRVKASCGREEVSLLGSQNHGFVSQNAVPFLRGLLSYPER